MILEGLCSFGVPAITNSNAATVSPNVFDAGSAINLFGARGSDLAVVGHAVLTADDNPTLKVELLGADNAALTTNPTVIGSTGIIVYKPDGSTALASGDDVPFKLHAVQQRVAKRYYGLMFTLGGTNPDTAGTAGGVAEADLVVNDQTNDYRAAAATP